MKFAHFVHPVVKSMEKTRWERVRSLRLHTSQNRDFLLIYQEILWKFHDDRRTKKGRLFPPSLLISSALGFCCWFFLSSTSVFLSSTPFAGVSRCGLSDNNRGDLGLLTALAHEVVLH